MDDRTHVYRKKAVDRLTSPDELTEMLTVGRSYTGWVLGGIGVALAAALAWGITGAVPVTAPGDGVVLSTGPARAVLYLDQEAAARVRAGQAVRLRPADPARQGLGSRTGLVEAVGGDPPADAWPPRVRVEVSVSGAEPPLPPRTPVTGEVVLGSRRPIALVLPGGGE